MTAPDSGGAARGAGDRADGLAGGVARLRRALRRGARVASPGNPLAVAQLELLSVVAEHPGARPGQLARLLHMRPSTVTTIVNARDRDATAGEHAVPGGCGPGTAVRARIRLIPRHSGGFRARLVRKPRPTCVKGNPSYPIQ